MNPLHLLGRRVLGKQSDGKHAALQGTNVQPTNGRVERDTLRALLMRMDGVLSGARSSLPDLATSTFCDTSPSTSLRAVGQVLD